VVRSAAVDEKVGIIEGLVVSASHSTLDLVVPWGNSSLDILETSLLVPMLQNAFKDTHDMWKREMETQINELVNQKIEKSENPNPILADAYVSERNQRQAQLETNEGMRRGLQSIQNRRSELQNKGEILSVERQVKSLQDNVNKLKLELYLARQSLPEFIRAHTRRYIDTISDRYKCATLLVWQWQTKSAASRAGTMQRLLSTRGSWCMKYRQCSRLHARRTFHSSLIATCARPLCKVSWLTD
jgi:hypothetical protein